MFVASMPPIATTGTRTAAFTSRSRSRLAGRVTGLRARGEDRAHGDVVGAGRFGALRFAGVVRRDANQQRTNERPHRLDRQVVLSEMYAVGAGGQREVRVVVDDEDSAVRVAERRDRPRFGELVALVAALVAPLQHPRAALERPQCDVRRRACHRMHRGR